MNKTFSFNQNPNNKSVGETLQLDAEYVYKLLYSRCALL